MLLIDAARLKLCQIMQLTLSKGRRYCQFHHKHWPSIGLLDIGSRQANWEQEGREILLKLEQILWCSRNKIGCGLQQNWLRPYDSSSSAPTALMNELSTANILSIHVPILKVYFLGGATRFEGSRSRQSQIGLCTGVSSPNWHPDTCQLGNPTSAPTLEACGTAPRTPGDKFWYQMFK